MRSIVLILMVIAGVVFAGSVMLMSPKGGLGVALGGVSSSNEYGSKKSLESTLKKTATASLVVFLMTAIALPYIS